MYRDEAPNESGIAENPKGVCDSVKVADPMTKAEIYRKDSKGRYIHSTSERQKMLVEMNSRK